MSVGSGISAQVGWAAEGTPGTYAAPTRFLPGDSFGVDKKFTTQDIDGLAAGRALAYDRVTTNESGTGVHTGSVLRSGFGLLIQHLMGGNVTPVQQGGTAAYLQTHVLTDNYGKALTMQVGVPDTGGTVRPYTALGCKIMDAEFSCSVGELLKATFNFDAKQITEAQSLVAASYGAGTNAQLPFHHGQMAVRLGTYASEASVGAVRGVNFKVGRPMDVERFYAGNAGLKSEPVWNGMVEISGTIETDYMTKADFVDCFVNQTSTSLVVEWIGPVIASTYYETFRLISPKTYFDAQIPPVGGPDLMKASVPFKGYLDTTNAVSAQYLSRDTAV
jgi:hypothetical protein